MLLTSTLGENVVSKASADTIGAVTGVVVDARARKITALQVGKGRKARVVAWADVSGIGSAAVVVERDDALREPTDDEHRYVGGDVAVIDGLVLSDRGNAHGKIIDVEYDEQTGSVVSIHTASTTVAADRLRSIGSYAWIVSAADDEPA